MWVGKKIKHDSLGCRVGKKSAVRIICRFDVSIIFCLFYGLVRLVFIMSPNYVFSLLGNY